MNGGGFALALVRGYTAPRGSARQLLDSGAGLEVALGMVALAYIVQAILTILFMSSGFGIGGHLMAVVQQLLTFFLLAALVYGIGRLAGGTGSMEGAQLVVAWHSLVTSLISPLAIGVSTAAFTAQMDETSEMPAGMGFMALLYVCISFWLMANYVAELHGFQSTMRVLGAVVAITFAFAILLIAVIGSVAPV